MYLRPDRVMNRRKTLVGTLLITDDKKIVLEFGRVRARGATGDGNAPKGRSPAKRHDPRQEVLGPHLLAPIIPIATPRNHGLERWRPCRTGARTRVPRPAREPADVDGSRALLP